MSGQFVEMAEMVCSECGITYFVTKGYQARRVADKQTFHCPAGHLQSYRGKTELEKERKARKEAEATTVIYQRWHQENREHIAALELSRSALRGQITRLKKRIVRGHCPFCGCWPVNYWNHLKAAHPSLLKKYGART